MKTSQWLLAFTLISLMQSCGVKQNQPNFEQIYTVDLNDRSDDKFDVVLKVQGLRSADSIFQFASTAPGTYQVMNIGRYVSDFKAFDTSGNELNVESISVNQFQLSQPENISTITYKVAETWDTPVEEYEIYAMCGTSIEKDHVLINGQGVFGYFHGHQASPIKIILEYPETWLIGTAMSKNSENQYLALTYDYLVDSPILLGELTRASKMVEETEVEVYTYSKTGMINSEEVLTDMNDMLFAASKFVNGLPVDRYTFLYLFEDRTAGAWEHSYSSEYIYKEGPWDQIGQGVVETAAHEFFHVITPLNIHSEIIQEFNFVTPVPSQHLWLYEGTTEWASHMMLLQDNLTTLDDYLEMLHNKVVTDKSFYRSDYSLVDLALNSYTKSGQSQYGNIYMRGALVAGLLDLQLLELSNGEMGLRDLANKLAQKYGPNRPFSEQVFFDEIVEMTYPEIGVFIDNYIKEAQPLPYNSLYATIGVNYQESLVIENESSLNLALYPVPQGLYVIQDKGEFKRGDFIRKINSTDVNSSNFKEFMNNFKSVNIGSEVSVELYRGNSPLVVQVKTEALILKDEFILNSEPSDKQLERRKVWMSSRN